MSSNNQGDNRKPQPTGNVLERLLSIIGVVATVFACYVGVLALSRQETREALIPNSPTATPIIVTVISERPIEVTKVVEITREVPVTVIVTRNIVSTNAAPAPAIDQQPNQTATPNAVESMSFSDDFEDNRNEWELGDTVGLSQNKLAITANAGESIWVPVPKIQADGNFYAQADMTIVAGHTCFANIGFSLGDKTNGVHKFLIVGDCSDNKIEVFDGVERKYSSPYKKEDVGVGQDCNGRFGGVERNIYLLCEWPTCCNLSY